MDPKYKAGRAVVTANRSQLNHSYGQSVHGTRAVLLFDVAGPSCTAVLLAQPLIEPLGFLGGAAEPTAIVLVTIVPTFLPRVMGELAPTDQVGY
jgi:hypothetical protein